MRTSVRVGKTRLSVVLLGRCVSDLGSGVSAKGIGADQGGTRGVGKDEEDGSTGRGVGAQGARASGKVGGADSGGDRAV